MVRQVLGFFLVLCGAGLAACGGDDSGSSNTAASPSTKETSGAGTVATSGQAGQSSSSPFGGFNIPQVMPVKCGSTMCGGQAGGIIGFAMPCCADEATGKCGMSAMGGACTVPSPGDPRCPMVSAFGGISITSCCTPDGMCGLDASMFGVGGCTELGAAAKQGGAMGGGAMIPPPRRCDEASGADAGM